MDCSLCSLSSFLFGCIKGLLWIALDNPILLIILCLLVATLVMTNVHSARFICNPVDNAAPAGSCVVCSNGGACGDCRPLAAGSAAPGGGGGASAARAQLLRLACARQATENFDYGMDNGPHTWNVAQNNQSPINILENSVVKLPIRELLTWNHIEDMPEAIMLHNTGTTVIMRAYYRGNTPTVSGADLLACYTFVELCFRWSAWNTEGSEHSINYRKYPLEVQAMFRTGPPTTCTSSYDILMVAYFYEIAAENPFLDPIIQNLHRIREPGQHVEIPPIPLSYLCYPFRSQFYSYGGSLTEPPCYEGAEWFVYPEPLALSLAQLDAFRQILGKNKSRMLRNARPLQELTDSRVVNINEYNPIDAVGSDLIDEQLTLAAEEVNAADESGGVCSPCSLNEE